MINIDRVYQKVLALANKEQRGYITPQEFNLIASEAQNDIFESYFDGDKRGLYDEQLPIGGELDMFKEKLNHFYVDSDAVTVAANVNTVTVPTAVYKIDTIHRDEGEVTLLSKKEILYTENNPLTKATTTRSTYTQDDSGIIRIYPTPSAQITLYFNYWQRPITTPNWNFVVVGEKALYNASTSTNFELHSSEQGMLVTKILEYAGIVTQKPDLQETGLMKSQLTKSEQNKQ